VKPLLNEDIGLPVLSALLQVCANSPVPLVLDMEVRDRGHYPYPAQRGILRTASHFLHCMDLGIDMPERFAKFQQAAEKALPDLRFKP